MIPIRQLLCLSIIFLAVSGLHAQEVPASTPSFANFPFRFIDKVRDNAHQLEESVMNKTNKSLRSLARLEKRLKRKLIKRDSMQAELLFEDVDARYEQLKITFTQSAQVDERASSYIPRLDTLKTSLRFLSQHTGLLQQVPTQNAKVKDALNELNDASMKLSQGNELKRILQERKQQLKDALSKWGLMKDVQKINKEVFYYGEQLHEYKALLEQPEKWEQQAIALLQKLPAFRDFVKQHSVLAGLFAVPANYASAESLQGLQTRGNVGAMMQNIVSAGGPNSVDALQQNILEAKNQLNQLKDKLNQFGNAGDGEMPDFKPNNQKTKSFLQRLEYGSNLQSQRSSFFFPTTTDIGVSVGYKINNASVVGIGASYKIGWGKDIRNINISSEGIGLRSFADYKIKGSFFASGGFEYNYQQPFSAINEIKDLDTWQKSGLLGVSKILSIKSKVFNKTKMQLLWDFLSYQQRPQASAIKFRVGYNF